MGLFGSKTIEENSSILENCTTLEHIHGKEIIKSLGLIEYTLKDVEGKVVSDIKAILNCLLQAAIDAGANAVVNVKLVSGSYDKQGSQWNSSYIIAYGDAVIAE